MNAWQRLIYATTYAVATAWFDARKASLRGIEEFPTSDDDARADAFRSAIVRAGQPGDTVGNHPPPAGK